MEQKAMIRWRLVLIVLFVHVAFQSQADGVYFSRTVAVSADQRAIIIKNGDEISLTLSTGYTGEGDDFAWVIPTPVPPAAGDVTEAGEKGEAAFKALDECSAARITKSCFPAGTMVLAGGGPRPIETIAPGTGVYACVLSTGEWTLRKVIERQSIRYSGDLIAVQIGDIAIRATGNHPFCVLAGERLGSRPWPEDVPRGDQMADGRWVEARHLRVGDLLKVKDGQPLAITGLSSRLETTEVYNLTVEGCHNYAVHEKGFLVHNKGQSEGPSQRATVSVHARVILRHYEAAILGADSALGLTSWLQANGYPVDPKAQRVLDSYVARGWAFVAAKLNPGERRPYRNDLLPPLTIKYSHDEFVFPLRISSVSTAGTARITLYVIAESTVTSRSYPTTHLSFDEELWEPVSPEVHIEACIRRTIPATGRGLAVTWSGELYDEDGASFPRRPALSGLMKTPFRRDQRTYLTRLEGRMDAASMEEDICFTVDPTAARFQVGIRTPVDIREVQEAPELVYAALGAPGAVSRLLAEGTDADAADTAGATALMYAARYNPSVQVIDELLRAGADVNRKNAAGWSPLMYAAASDNPEIVRALLKAGADVNARTKSGETPIKHAAAHNRNPAITDALCTGGADVTAETGNYPGQTALVYAARFNPNPEVLCTLLRAGCEVNARNTQGETALMFAWLMRLDAVRILLDGGADVNARGNDGRMPLMRAATTPFGDPCEILRTLINAGADVNARTRDGHTALMLVARDDWASNPDQVIALLLEAGADAKARSNEALTALDYARSNSRLKDTRGYQMLVDAQN